MIAQWLGGGGTAENDLLLQTDVGRGSTHLDDVCARLDVPLANTTLMAVEAKLIGEEARGDGLRLSWLQRDAGEALQLKGTYLQGVVLGREVDLRNLVSGHAARVLHLEGQFHEVVGGLSLAGCLQVLIVEGGVTQAVAKGPLDFRGLRLEVGGQGWVQGQGIVAKRLVEFGAGIGDGEFG